MRHFRDRLRDEGITVHYRCLGEPDAPDSLGTGLEEAIRPHDVHCWYLAVYADAVEWVELPNTLGMSQFADGGVMATKPYAASGKYINRMSNYCGECRFNPDERTGADACPFTTLYWDFLLRNRERLSDNPRMALQLRNLDRLEPDQLNSIRHRAGNVREVCQ